LTLSALDAQASGESSAVIRERVAAAHVFRRQREMRQRVAVSRALEDRSHLTREARALLRQALVREGLSGRAYVRIISLARTIADLDNVLPVRADHLAEALALRLDHRRVGFA
jgi:magnesium chelatase family protein